MTYKSKICNNCKKEYIPNCSTSKYCSKECRMIVLKERRLEFRIKNPEIIKQKYHNDYIRNIEQKRKYAADRYHEKKDDADFANSKKKAYKKYYQTHKGKLRVRQNIYDLKHSYHLSEMAKKRRASIEGKLNRIRWEKENRMHIRHYVKCRVQKNPNIAIAHRLSASLCHALKNKKHDDISTWIIEKILGCSIQQFRKYIENQFKDGMTWENYTYHGWHIDHKIPICMFDLSKQESISVCFHYTNLQPLWREENQSKGIKI